VGPWPRTGAMMGGANLQPKVIAALLSAGATEEMIAGARQILGACATRTVGRPRKYPNRSECDRAYKLRRKERARKREEIRGRLHGAAQGQVEPELDVEPIRALLDRGCDLESGGRPRKYKNRAECDRAYRERRKQREKTCEEYSRAPLRCGSVADRARADVPSSTRAEPRRVPFADRRATGAISDAGLNS
jgi:hypothetical protein